MGPTPDAQQPTPTSRAPILYLVTDRHATRGRPLLDVVAQALQGGVDTVQLREKDLSAHDLLALAEALLDLCHSHGARLLINDRIDVALAVGADGVQLPASSFAANDARALLGDAALIGCSTHSLPEAQAAAAAGADFVVFGPVFDTPSKRGYGPPLGLESLAATCRALSAPVVAVGGIAPANAASVWSSGVAGLAVIGAVLKAEDPRGAAVALRSLAGR